MEENFDKISPNTPIELVYGKFVAYWQNLYGCFPEVVTDKQIGDSWILEKFAQEKNALLLIVHNKTLSILHIGDNVKEFFGYSADECKESQMLMLFRLLSWEHILCPFQLVRVGNIAVQQFPLAAKQVYQAFYFCGIKMKHKDGHTIRVLTKWIPLSLNEYGNQGMSIVLIEDVAHLMKGDHYWARWEAGNPAEPAISYHSNVKRSVNQDILSDREKDVLRLIASGLGSKEIAEILYISTKTVETHRKNMIARTGARDATALMQLCKMCGIV